MPLGTYGSTLLSELNRLANGGTYPPVNLYDEAAAARAWAGRTDIPLTATDTVGVLNEIAGLPRDQWLDYSGVCNYLAGTTDLPAAAALRQIEGNVQTPTPSEPLLLFATPGDASVTLNWAPPANEGDGPVLSYTVVCNRPGVPNVTVASGPVLIGGLENGVSYRFNVYATNAFGDGPWSDSSTLVTPVEAPKPLVSGGTLTADANFYYRTFLNNETLNVANAPLEVEAVIIAGGASGSGEGGGGAGGWTLQTINLPATSYQVTVGAGGPISWPNASGQNSELAGVVTLGGAYAEGGTGGSGCGGYNGWVSYATPGQGYPGGAQGPSFSPGGGGGAGGAGTGGQGFRRGGDGGIGIYLPDWASATGTGVGGYYAGGGGGGGNIAQGAGGAGGGGQGWYDSYQQTAQIPQLQGVPNTGGGGGGRGGNIGGAGGSGIVIIRYPKTAVA